MEYTDKECHCHRVANQCDHLFRKNIVAEYHLNGILKQNVQLTAKIKRLEAHVKGMETYARRMSKNGFIEITRDQMSDTFHNRVKLALFRMFSLSSGHGLPNFVRAERCSIKFLWIVAFLLVISGFGYFINKSFNDYYSYQVITNINIYDVKQMTFPSVTICNKNPGSLKIEKLLFFCKFNGRECDASDFKTVELFDDINLGIKECVIFNYMTKRVLDKKGNMNGLVVQLLLLEKDYFKIMINDHDLKPQLVETDEIVTRGTHVNLKLNKLVDKKLAEPFNKCHINLSADRREVLHDIITKSGYRYDQSYCQQLCHFEHIFKTCNCSMPGTDEITNFRHCLKKDKFFIQNCFANEYKRSDFDFVRECSKRCPLKCVTTSYKIKSQYLESKIEFDEFAESDLVIKKRIKHRINVTDISIDDIVRKTFSMSIFFKEFKYTAITQIPKSTVPDLVSNFGGTLGLFLGLSLLSFMEFVEFMCELVLLMVNYLKGFSFR